MKKNSKTTTLTADKIISQKDAKRLLKECEIAKDAALGTSKNAKCINDYYMFSGAYLLGSRVTETVDLKWGDYDNTNYYIIIRNGKGGKSRNIVIGKKTIMLLEEYKKIQQEFFGFSCDHDDYIFRHPRKKKLTRFIVHDRFKLWANKLGLPKSLSFHSLRHAAGTRWLDQGLPLSMVRDQLGHSNIAITSVYLHFSESAKAKARAVM